MKILICASGDQYIEEAKRFIQNHQELDFVVGTDMPNKFSLVETFLIEESSYKSKIKAMLNCPYDEFLYVDCDTKVVSLEGIEFYKNRYDIACCYEVLGATEKFFECDRLPDYDIYADEPEFQTGVVYINRTKEIQNFLKCWYRIHTEIENSGVSKVPDQASFKRAVKNTKVIVGIMTNNWNFRACYSQLISGKIKIIHCRHPNPTLISKRFLDSITPRYFVNRFIQNLDLNSFIFKLIRYFDR